MARVKDLDKQKAPDWVNCSYTGYNDSFYNFALQAIERVFGITPEALKSKVRKREVVYARAIFCTACYQQGFTFMELGRRLGRSHSAIVYYLSLCKSEYQLKGQFDYFMEKMYQ